MLRGREPNDVDVIGRRSSSDGAKRNPGLHMIWHASRISGLEPCIQATRYTDEATAFAKANDITLFTGEMLLMTLNVSPPGWFLGLPGLSALQREMGEA